MLLPEIGACTALTWLSLVGSLGPAVHAVCAVVGVFMLQFRPRLLPPRRLSVLAPRSWGCRGVEALEPSTHHHAAPILGAIHALPC